MNTEKMFISLRYWMLGRGYHLSLDALEFASKFHKGLRKDNKTPEFYHQLSIAQYVRTLIHDLDFPEETLAAACLHDVCEDYDVGFDEIAKRFGKKVGKSVFALTKTYRGANIQTEQYYREIAKNNIASVVKGADRVNNIQSMVGVFDCNKQKQYIEETETYILPMLKTARRSFSSQEGVYENIKLMLCSQIELIKAIHAVASDPNYIYIPPVKVSLGPLA